MARFVHLLKVRLDEESRRGTLSVVLLSLGHSFFQRGVKIMKWETPAYNDTRFGFEVTMYINNR